MLLYVLQALSPAVAAVLARRGATADDPELTAVTALAGGLLSLAHLAVYLTTGALVMIWMFRARKNTDAFPGARSQLAAHWAITGWWVPVASLVVPFVVMARIVRDSLGRVRLRALVAVWWLAWLAFVVTDLLTSLAAAKADLLLADQAQDFD
ncbi:protein of unknown function [Micromonospora rhizosphaerae]|uniref:DUF4328 domain-containing protein n=1 Tax=Micromonospora rhizosphaerae TaxID=568872 RepID=A0A1C6RQY3_9ACTN|nr:DUF4328 domain-containing protein [Micromonospora rhizosphaerae]SCL19439.1 protein of unknown function [Micromonospora rhizosphaerae]